MKLPLDAIAGAGHTGDPPVARPPGDPLDSCASHQELDGLVADGDPVLIPLGQYLQWFERKLSPASRQAVIKAFGPPPGKIMTIDKKISSR